MNLDVIYNKSCQRMDELPDNSVDTILTSCPYWGLRNYGDDVKEIWGGSPDCEHEWGNDILPKGNKSGPHGPGSTIGAKLGQDGARRGKGSNFCQKCNAWHGQLGLEPTLQMYIDHLLLITLECKRVLKPTGVMWWNHGDSYFTGKGSCHNPGGGDKNWKSWNERKSMYPTGTAAPNRMSKESPPKCLALQNFRLIIRMIDEQGWTLRNAAIWEKPNSMPSSTKDRLANKYEPVFCLVKNTKPRYYWNEKTALMVDRKPSKANQIEDTDWEWRECPKCSGHGEIIKGVQAGDNDHKIVLSEKGPEICPRCKRKGKIKYSFWHNLGYWFDLDAIREPHKESSKKRYNYSLDGSYTPGNAYLNEKREKPQHYNLESLKSVGKNPGNVWKIPTQPRKECHFAAFPDALTIKPILATCPQEICKKCGKPRVRITRKGELVRAGKGHVSYGYKGGSKHQQNEKSAVSSWSQNFVKDGLIPGMAYKQETIGWTDCGCTILTCKNCNAIIEDYASQRPRKKEAISAGMVSEKQADTSQIQQIQRQNVRDLQEDIQRQQSENMLSDLFNQTSTQRKQNADFSEGPTTAKLEGRTNKTPRLHLPTSEKSSKRNQKRLRNGASSNNGEALGTTAPTLGRCSPSQRKERRQSDRKSNCSASQKASQPSNNLPILPQKVHNLICPNCGSTDIEEKRAGFEPGVVLDPFAGRGTALIMAKKLGRHYVGYELKKEYCEKLIKPALEEMDPLFAQAGRRI